MKSIVLIIMIIVIKNAPATWNQEMQHLREVIIVQSCSWIVVRLYDDIDDNDDKDVNTTNLSTTAP